MNKLIIIPHGPSDNNDEDHRHCYGCSTINFQFIFNDDIKNYIPNINNYRCSVCNVNCSYCLNFELEAKNQDFFTFLHSTEEPAILDLVTGRKAYMINGVKYKKEEWKKLVGKSNE